MAGEQARQRAGHRVWQRARQGGGKGTEDIASAARGGGGGKGRRGGGGLRRTHEPGGEARRGAELCGGRGHARGRGRSRGRARAVDVAAGTAHLRRRAQQLGAEVHFNCGLGRRTYD